MTWTSLVVQTVKLLPTMRETRVRSLGWEDPLKKEMAIHSRTIAWKIPWTEEPGRLQPMESQRATTEWLYFHFLFLKVITTYKIFTTISVDNRNPSFIFFLFKKNIILFLNFWLRWVFIATTGFSLAVSRGCSIVAGPRLLTVVAPLAMERGLWGTWARSVAAAHAL